MLNCHIIALSIKKIPSPQDHAAFNFGQGLIELVEKISPNEYHYGFDIHQNYTVEQLFPSIFFHAQATPEEYLLIIGISALLHENNDQELPAYIQDLLHTAPAMISARALDFLFMPQTPRDYLIGLAELFESRTCHSFIMHYTVSLFKNTYSDGCIDNHYRTNIHKHTHWDIVLGFINDPSITNTLPVLLRLMINMFDYGAADKTVMHPVDSTNQQREGFAEINKFKTTIEDLKKLTKKQKINVYKYTLQPLLGKEIYQDISIPAWLTAQIRRQRHIQTIKLAAPINDTHYFNTRFIMQLYAFVKNILLAPQNTNRLKKTTIPSPTIEVITQARVNLCLLLNIHPSSPRAKIITRAREELRAQHPDTTKTQYDKEALLQLMGAYKLFYKECKIQEVYRTQSQN